MVKPLSIVGIDPGTTTGFAVLDLKGNCLQIYSAKDLSLSQMISKIIAISQPIITSTDKEKVPSFVADFSSSLGTLLISPKEDLKKEQKKTFVKGLKFNNDHQMDSLAAGIYAHKKVRHTLDKIIRFIQDNNIKEKLLFAKLVLKEKVNLQQAKEILHQPEEKKIVEKVLDDRITKTDYFSLMAKFQSLKSKTEYYEKKVKRFNEEKKMLKQTNVLLAKKLNNTDLKIDKLLSFKEKRIKDVSFHLEKEKKRVKELEEEKQRLIDFIPKVQTNILAKKVQDLGKNSITNEMLNHNYLFVEKPEVFSEKVLQKIANKEIVLLSKKQFNSRIKKSCKTYQVKETDENNDFCLIRELPAEKQINENNLSMMIDEYKKRKN